MATKEEWKDYFQMMNEREPTLAEFEAALKTGEIENKSLSATEKPSGSAREAVSADKSGNLASKKKTRKWIWIVTAVVVVLGIGGGVFEYVNYQKSQVVNEANIISYLRNQNRNLELFSGDSYPPLSRLEKNFYKIKPSSFSIFSGDSFIYYDGKNLYLIGQASEPYITDEMVNNKFGTTESSSSHSQSVKWVIVQEVDNVSANQPYKFVGVITNLNQIPAAK